MIIGQITCLICVSITCIYCLFVIHDKYKSNKKEDKPSIETPRYDELYLRQYRQGIYNICDCVQDNGEFWIYLQDYIAWQSGYVSTNIKDMSIFIASTRNIYRPDKYELILQTNMPLERIESLYNSVVYRIIVLKKYKKEIKTMDEKQKILNDIEEAQRKLDEARKKLDEYNTGYKRWKPKENEKFWYIDSYGSVNYTCFMSGTEADTKKFENYNCFKTEGEALQEAEKILVRRQLEDITKRLNKGEKIDWHNEEQPKYSIRFDYYPGKIVLDCCFRQQALGVVYCLDKNFLDIAKREIGEDRLIKYIRGEG